MIFIFSAYGKEKTVNHILKIFPKNPAHTKEYIEFENNGKVSLLFPLYKFADLNLEDIANIYRICLLKNAEKAVVFCKKPNRAILSFTSNFNINFDFKLPRFVHKLFKKHNALPKPICIGKKTKQKVKLRDLFDGIFVKEKLRFYLFSATFLFFFSIFTPLKLYYICLASISLVMASITLIKNFNN